MLTFLVMCCVSRVNEQHVNFFAVFYGYFLWFPNQASQDKVICERIIGGLMVKWENKNSKTFFGLKMTVWKVQGGQNTHQTYTKTHNNTDAIYCLVSLFVYN